MKIDRTPVAWKLERLFCECGGEVKATGMQLLTYPVQYPHKCEKCDFGITMRESYPRVMWEEIKPAVAEPPLPAGLTITPKSVK